MYPCNCQQINLSVAEVKGVTYTSHHASAYIIAAFAMQLHAFAMQLHAFAMQLHAEPKCLQQSQTGILQDSILLFNCCY